MVAREGRLISGDPAWEAFIRAHRWAVLTSLRRTGSPVSSLVAYAPNGDDLVVSTRAETFKHNSIARDERVNLCILSAREPFDFVAVEGTCVIERSGLVPATRLVFAAIKDTPYQEPEDLEGWLESEGRVILRITPLRTYGVIRGLAEA